MATFIYQPSLDIFEGHFLTSFIDNVNSTVIEVSPATPLPVSITGSIPIGPVTISGLVSVQDSSVIALLTEISAKLTLILARLPADNSEE